MKNLKLYFFLMIFLERSIDFAIYIQSFIFYENSTITEEKKRIHNAYGSHIRTLYQHVQKQYLQSKSFMEIAKSKTIIFGYLVM